MPDSDRLQTFIDDKKTLFQRIQYQYGLFTKVDDREIDGVRYVTLRVNRHFEPTHLQIYRQYKRKYWRSLCHYYLDNHYFQFHWATAMEDIFVIINDYEEQMGVFR